MILGGQPPGKVGRCWGRGRDVAPCAASFFPLFAKIQPNRCPQFNVSNSDCNNGKLLLFEGIMTVLARLVAPIMTDTATGYLSLIGSVLIFCVGVNLVWGKKIRVANMLPSLFLAVIAAYLPPM